MKKGYLPLLILAALFCAKDLHAKKLDLLSKKCSVVSVYYSAPDNAQRYFSNVVFRFGWSREKPCKISVQFVNRSYSDRKIKFAIKDITSKKMVVLDTVHNSRFGTEMLKANSEGTIWSGPIDDANDSFSLRIWDSAGDQLDKVAISIEDQQ